ncbi:uncharacterized protein LOC120197326 [Hibiscus syriacus]|uniref:uncharacterized protein LOC120197326 n=1 Tax=Hibiscus syriacus TaxID=106335 RepID=UPI0019241F43|nr:uncharacterized protein LOC120197326 [Hibiscus syriacus]
MEFPFPTCKISAFKTDFTKTALPARDNVPAFVLTEVLLKVTDELFNEIATIVVNEDGSIIEVDHNSVASNHKESPSSSLIPTPKASARVLVPGKAKEPDTAEEKSSSSSPGNVLGLANYASDDEDVDGEIQSSRMTYSRSNDSVVQSSTNKLSQDNGLTERYFTGST